jgi:hypothetical protein
MQAQAGAFQELFGPPEDLEKWPQFLPLSIVICKCDTRNKTSFKILFQCLMIDMFEIQM